MKVLKILFFLIFTLLLGITNAQNRILSPRGGGNFVLDSMVFFETSKTIIGNIVEVRRLQHYIYNTEDSLIEDRYYEIDSLGRRNLLNSCNYKYESKLLKYKECSQIGGGKFKSKYTSSSIGYGWVDSIYSLFDDTFRYNQRRSYFKNNSGRYDSIIDYNHIDNRFLGQQPYDAVWFFTHFKYDNIGRIAEKYSNIGEVTGAPFMTTYLKKEYNQKSQVSRIYYRSPSSDSFDSYEQFYYDSYGNLDSVIIYRKGWFGGTFKNEGNSSIYKYDYSLKYDSFATRNYPFFYNREIHHLPIEETWYIDANSHRNYKYYYSEKKLSNILNSKQETIVLYPNPIQNILHINSYDNDLEFNLYNLLGKLVIERNFSFEESINLEELSAGIYYVIIKNKRNEIIHRQKILKEKL